MEKDTSHIHIPGLETSRFRYRKHNQDGSPVVTTEVLLDAVVSDLVKPTSTGTILYERQKNPK